MNLLIKNTVQLLAFAGVPPANQSLQHINQGTNIFFVLPRIIVTLHILIKLTGFKNGI
jgi:hypothetical protein